MAGDRDGEHMGASEQPQAARRPLVSPSREDFRVARRIHDRFAVLDGARGGEGNRILADRPARSWQYPAPDLGIANVTALSFLAACLRVLKPARILELGAGIGTMTALMLEKAPKKTRIIATEDNDFCLRALERNLPDNRDRLHIVTGIEELLSLEGDYDLAICDGGFDRQEQFRGIVPGSVCLFEGGRAAHRRLLDRYLSRFGWRYAPQNYPSPGYILKILPRRWNLLGLPMPMIKIRRKKGCWLGRVEENGGA